MNNPYKPFFRLSLPLLLLATSISATAQSQTPASRLVYDAVSIKPGNGGEFYWAVTDNLSISRNVPLHNYVTSAFRLRFADQLAGLPAWADNSTYSIQAKIGEQTVQYFQSISYAEQWKLRGQMDLAILEDDFHLRWHRESRIRPVYELVPAKGGIKMPLHPAGKPDSWRFHPGHVQAEALSIHQLISMILSNDADIDRVVLDRTQPTGLYDIDLQWTPTGEQNSNTNSPAIFTALREQLGLELRPVKAPIDVIVIDSIARPSSE